VDGLSTLRKGLQLEDLQAADDVLETGRQSISVERVLIRRSQTVTTFVTQLGPRPHRPEAPDRRDVPAPPERGRGDMLSDPQDQGIAAIAWPRDDARLEIRRQYRREQSLPPRPFDKAVLLPIARGLQHEHTPIRQSPRLEIRGPAEYPEPGSYNHQESSGE
jgi:hypothetical protein